MATEMPGFGPPESAVPENPPPPAPAPNEMAPGLASLLGVHERQAAAKPSAIPAGLVGPDAGASARLAPAKPKRKNAMWPIALLAGIVVGLLVLFAAAYFLRGPILRAMPGAERIYSLIGLAPVDHVTELQLGNLKYERRGSALLSIRGDIFNPTEMPQKVPPVWVLAFDAAGNQIDSSLMFRTQESEIAPGETLTFRMLYENAPAATKTLRAIFGRVDR